MHVQSYGVSLVSPRWTLHWTSVSSQDDGTGEDSQPLCGQGWWTIMLVLCYGTAAWNMLTLDVPNHDTRDSCLRLLLFPSFSSSWALLLRICFMFAVGGLTMIDFCLLPLWWQYDGLSCNMACSWRHAPFHQLKQITCSLATACFPVSVVSFHNLPNEIHEE